MAEIDPLRPQTQHERISVVMPVHNALPHLDAAIGSILSQTYRNFELVILDDGSTDGSTQRLREWAALDQRIRVIEGKQNLGPARSSNYAVQQARSPLIARMDADDVSHPERLARQLDLLQERPDVGLVGTLCQIIDGDGRKLREAEVWRLTRRSVFAPFPHGSIMFRRDLFDRIGGYRAECDYWEDQDLVVRMSSVTNILVIPSPLYQHRQSTTSTRIASDQERVERSVDLMYRSVERVIHNQSYEDLLGAHGQRSEQIDPRVFISLGSLVLWSGGKPKLLNRVIKRGKLRFNMRTLSALVWTSWARVSPSSLRALLGLIVAARNSAASAKISGDRPIIWSPHTSGDTASP